MLIKILNYVITISMFHLLLPERIQHAAILTLTENAVNEVLKLNLRIFISVKCIVIT